MATRSPIEWTDFTWNPLTGCNKVSPGCKNCYAERMAHRLKAMGVPKYRNGFELTLHESILEEPLSWKKPRIVFVNSMSDMFHERVPNDFIVKLFDIMRLAEQHVFQVLTKRSRRLLQVGQLIDWPENVWMGVSVENNRYTFRIDDLRQSGAKRKFLSIEPLLGRIPDINLKGIHWVIVGGESGPGSRPVQEEWVVEIRDQCLEEGIPFFFKQWGGTHKKRAGRTLQGRTWEQMPEQIPALSS